MINGLVLFANTGGTTLALKDIVRPAAYHEPRKAYRGLLLSNRFRHAREDQICTDQLADLSEVCKVPEQQGLIDILHGSLPTQAEYARLVKRELGEEQRAEKAGGIIRDSKCTEKPFKSCRRDLYQQIYELAKEIQPKFLFFEIKPSETKPKQFQRKGSVGIQSLVGKLSEIGYDCRWDTLSAFDVGSPQKRERVYLLARKREEVIRNSTSADSRTGIMEHKGLDDIRTHSDFLERTPRRLAEVEAGLDEICAPQYREAFLRLSGLNSINQKN